MSLFMNPDQDNRSVFLPDEGETLPVDSSAVAEPLSSNRRTILPVIRWENFQFSPTVSPQRVKTGPAPLPCFRMISEAPVSERETAFVRRIWSFRRVGRSRGGVRFHTAVKSEAT